MSRGTFFKTVAIAALMGTQAQAAAVSLSYGSTMPAEQIDRLNADVAAISTMKFVDASGEIQRIMKLPDTSAASMEGWLAERAHFVVGESFEISANTIVPVEPITTAIAQLSHSFNPLDAAAAIAPGGTSAAAPRRARIIMSNIGTALYAMGKQNGFVLGVKLQGEEGVILRSPRVGLFQVGEGLFQTLHPSLPASALADPLHVAFRMETLFHEARHDDGNKTSLGFMHTICPAGHDYAGVPACDIPSNGPYRIGAMFLRSLIEGCGTNGCQPGAREVLTMMYADNANRVLSPMPHDKITVASDLCTRLNAVKPGNSICNAPAVAAAVVEWDDSPEVIPESPQ